MAFKRYIYKHGKKLGPYYYENVRSQDGRVKTVYLGTNPNPIHHHKHRIKKPLFFLILVLVLILILGGSLFFLQNRAYLIKKVRLQEPDFDIDQILLKVLIKSKEFVGRQVRIMNTGNQKTDINVEVFGLLDIVNLDSTSFTLNPGQTKVVNLNFSSFTEELKIEQQPGIYVGKLVVKSEKATKEIPIVVEIEAKNVLFDMNLNPVASERKVKQGSDTTIEVRLFNLQSIESTNVDVEYFVKDMNGNTILIESETVVVKTQAYFSKTISIPQKLKPGPYVFAAQSRFGNSIGTSSYLFEVIGPETGASFVDFCKNSILCLGLSLTTILLLFALTAYFYFFIGAYLYEKITGIATLPRKKEEKVSERVEEEVAEMPSIFERVKEKLEEKRSGTKLKKFYRILHKSKDAIDNKDIPKVDKLFMDARDLYVDLEDQEKQEVYDKLLRLHEQLNQLIKEKKYEEKLRIKEKAEKQKISEQQKKLEVTQREEEKRRFQEEIKRKEEEIRKQKELERIEHERERKEQEDRLRRQREFEAKQSEEEKEKKKLERERLWRERKERAKEFLHGIGFYKTPEEKKQIALQKEREKQERKRREEESRKQRELEERRKKEFEEKLIENKKLEKFYKVLHEVKEAIGKDDVSKVDELYIKARDLYIGLPNERKHEVYSNLTEVYNKRNKLVEERKKQEELRTQREGERQRAEEEKKKRKEELKRQEEIEQKQKEQQRLAEERKRELETAKQEEERKKRLEDLGLRKELEKKEPKEKKVRWFKTLFKKEKPELEATTELEKIPAGKPSIFGKLFEKAKTEEEKAKETKIPKSEVEELEEAIRSLGLFKKIEKKEFGVKEKPKEEIDTQKKKTIREKIQRQKPAQVKEITFGKLFTKIKKKEEPEELKVKAEKKIVGKSKKFGKLHNILNKSKEALKKDDISKAKKLYAEARNLYIGLEYEEKKIVHDELMDLYNKLPK